MKVFIFEVDGCVSTGFSQHEDLISVANIVVPHGTPYIVKDASELPTEPIESWYIENGEIKIDQQKLIEFNRKNMLTLTPIEFDIKLIDAGLYDRVQELIQSDVKLKIAYTRATFFSRTNPFVDQVSEALGLTPERVDEIWTS